MDATMEGFFNQYVYENSQEAKDAILESLKLMVDLGYSQRCIKLYSTIYHALRDIEVNKYDKDN